MKNFLFSIFAVLYIGNVYANNLPDSLLYKNHLSILTSFKIYDLEQGTEKLISSPKIISIEGQEASMI